jgi:L-ascorbate metabolism protein UlaG (beta-lactamase superfamily)
MIYKNIELRWLGHSGFKIKTENAVVFIDPFRLLVSDTQEKADFIFITHSHYDHCSIEDIRNITKNGTIIICTPDCQSKFRHIVDNIQVKIVEPGKQMQFDDFGIRFWCVRAYNISKNFHAKEEDWVGYIIDFSGILIYHAGDSDLIPEMKNIKEIDIALLPIGGTYTMNAGEAAKAASIIKPKIAVPMHYNSIVGSKDDAEIFVRLCSSEDVDAKILERG